MANIWLIVMANYMITLFADPFFKVGSSRPLIPLPCCLFFVWIKINAKPSLASYVLFEAVFNSLAAAMSL